MTYFINLQEELLEANKMRPFISFVRKEFYHIFRDPRTMLILLAMPIVQIILFGFAISTEVKNSRLAIYDPSQDALTHLITQKIGASEYFTLTSFLKSPTEANDLFLRGEIDMALVFTPNFENNLVTTGTTDLELIADASDPNNATITTNYASAIISSAVPQLPAITPQIKLLYNPGMKSSYNFVPGVMGLILMLICAMMTSISIVREKERGTMEILLVSPMRPLTIILAKVVPYFVLSIINLGTILVLSVFVLGVPIAGSLFWLTILAMLFIFVALSLGLLISTLVESQVAAMMVSGMVLMMPTVLLSGMMFPIENMPWPLQAFSAIIPARWFIEAVRKIMIQGVEIQYIFKEILILCVMAILFVSVSLKKFKIRL